MNKKHNRLLDSSKIQQEPLPKDKVKRNQVSGNIGENMNSEFHEKKVIKEMEFNDEISTCLLYTSPSPRDRTRSRMPSSA